MQKLSINQLKPGMFLARAVINKDLIVLLSAGSMLARKDIKKLAFLHIPYVYIKEAHELSTDHQSMSVIVNRENAFIKKYRDVISEAAELFDRIGQNKNIDWKISGAKIKYSLLPTIKESGVIDYLYKLSDVSDSTCQHCVRVSVLCGVIGKWLKFDIAKISELILAGFLHDIGKAVLPKEIADKSPAKLTPDEYDIYIQHTINGQKMLSDKPGISLHISAAVLQHHEAMDGTGDPFGIAGDDIDKCARIVAVADCYDNLTAEREGEIKRTPFDAIKIINRKMYSSLDAQICVPFINNIQNAFLGSEVELSDGQKGKIIYYPPDYSSLPSIKISNGSLIDTVIDLNKEKYRNLNIIRYNPK